MLNAQLPKTLRSRAVGYWTAATSIMLALGPLVGGYLVDLFSWRAIFLFNVPLALIAIGLALVALKETPIRRGIHIDWVGAVLAFLFLGGIASGLIEGPANGWPPITIAALVAGACVLLPLCGGRAGRPIRLSISPSSATGIFPPPTPQRSCSMRPSADSGFCSPISCKPRPTFRPPPRERRSCRCP